MPKSSFSANKHDINNNNKLLFISRNVSEHKTLTTTQRNKILRERESRLKKVSKAKRKKTKPKAWAKINSIAKQQVYNLLRTT